MKRSELIDLLRHMPGEDMDAEVMFFLNGDAEELSLESLSHYLEGGSTVMNFEIKREGDEI